MKLLNELLREYVEKSNYTIYSLSYISKINRTTLQRAISGERPISSENLEKLLPYLNLTPVERKELEKAFLVSQIGEYTYRKHMYIKEFLESIDIMNDSFYSNTKFPFISLDMPFDNAHMIKGGFNIIKIICQIASYNVINEETPYLYAVSHFHNRFFYDLYKQLQIPYYKKLKIWHIVPFIKSPGGNTDDSLFNLHVLSTLFPFALSDPSNCSLYYYYEETNSSSLSGIPFPYYIVCNHNAILLTGDCETALLLPDTATAYYLQHFYQLKESSLPLLDTVDGPSYLSVMSFVHKAVSFRALTSQPCIFAFLDRSIIGSMINKNLPEKQQQALENMLLSQCSQLKKLSDALSFFSLKGYEDFVQRGIICQTPSELFCPLTVEDRMSILRRMIHSNQTGEFKLHMIKAEAFHPRIEFFIYDNSSILFNYSPSDTRKMQTCIIKEPNIIGSFHDFLLKLPSYRFVYSIEETTAIFQNSLEQLKQLPPRRSRTRVLGK